MLSTYSSDADDAPEFCRARPGAPPRRLRLRTNFLWTLSGNITYVACQWGILVVLAKLGTPQMVGQFALALAITAPVIIGAGMALRSVQATDAAAEYRFGDYLLLRLFMTALAGLVILGIVWFSGYDRHTASVILVVGLAKGLESISDIFYGLLQQHERMDRIAVSMMIKGLLSLVAVACAVCLGRDLLLGCCSLAAAWAVILVVYDVRSGASVLPPSQEAGRAAAAARAGMARRLHLQWRPRAVLPLTLLALPVGVVMALLSFNANIPRYFIQHYLGTRELGIFAALAYPLTAGTTVIGALGQSASPRLARHYVQGDYRAFSSLLRKLVCLSSLIGLVGILLIWLAGRPILLLLYQPEYADQVTAFFWLAVAAGIGYAASLLGYGMTAARYLRAQVPVFLAVTLVTAAACAVLVPGHKLSGAAIAMMLATVCQIAGSSAVIAHALRSRN